MHRLNTQTLVRGTKAWSESEVMISQLERKVIPSVAVEFSGAVWSHAKSQEKATNDLLFGNGSSLVRSTHHYLNDFVIASNTQNVGHLLPLHRSNCSE